MISWLRKEAPWRIWIRAVKQKPEWCSEPKKKQGEKKILHQITVKLISSSSFFVPFPLPLLLCHDYWSITLSKMHREWSVERDKEKRQRGTGKEALKVYVFFFFCLHRHIHMYVHIFTPPDRELMKGSLFKASQSNLQECKPNSEKKRTRSSGYWIEAKQDKSDKMSRGCWYVSFYFLPPPTALSVRTALIC